LHVGVARLVEACCPSSRRRGVIRGGGGWNGRNHVAGRPLDELGVLQVGTLTQHLGVRIYVQLGRRRLRGGLVGGALGADGPDGLWRGLDTGRHQGVGAGRDQNSVGVLLSAPVRCPLKPVLRERILEHVRGGSRRRGVRGGCLVQVHGLLAVA